MTNQRYLNCGNVGAYMAQESRCIQAAADYTQGRMSLTAFLEECFLLVYESTRLGVGLESWPREQMDVVDEAALELTRHWREFVCAIPELKRRVLAYETADIQTHKQRLAIESRWREALDIVEAGYDYGDFETRPTALDKPFFESMTNKETK